MSEKEVPPVDRSKRETLHGTPIGEHLEIDPQTGMQKDYIVLTAEERSKGFVRPVYESYRHVGRRPKHPTRALTDEENAKYNNAKDEDPFVLYETYPPELAPKKGRFWTKKELRSGCGGVTTMGKKLCETYARDPKFYSGTYCATCGAHFPVGEDGEFVWQGTTLLVGT
jgi:hypothetical protein